MNNNIRILTKEEYEKVPDDYKQAIVSEFAICLGARYYSEKRAEVKLDGVIKSGYVGTYWIDNIKKNKSEYYCLTMIANNPYFKPDIGLRFVADIPEDALTYIDKDGNKLVKYGTYPSKMADKTISNFIRKNGIKSTEKITIYKAGELTELDSYEYDGKYYVAMDGISSYKNSDLKLSDDTIISAYINETIYFEVEPITWLDIGNNKMVCSEILLAGIPFTFDKNKNISSYNETEIHSFVKNYFVDDIFKLNLQETNENNIVEEKEVELKYLYDIEPTIFERMDLALSLDQIVYLHGLPASGKSDRVLQLDPNATIVYLASEDPSLLYGAEMLDRESIDENKTVKTKMILSYWARDIIRKAEEDPDNIHVLFFDEFTNAHPQVQALVMQLIDNRCIGEYSLPENVRIVLAGNEITDSSIAHSIVEPLKSRVTHIKVEINVPEWLDWAYKHQINPYITSFIRLNDDYLRTEFTGLAPNADPRRWEMASKVLTKTNNPKSIKGLIDDDIVEEFIKFCSLSKDITVNEFLSLQRFDNNDINFKYSVISSLVDKIVDSTELVQVINKMKEFNFEQQDIDTFEMSWIKGDDTRREIVNYIDVSGSSIEYNFENIDNKLSYEDINDEALLKYYIDSNVSIFLHGQPGIGKSARVARIDPKCVIVDLAKENKDSIVGTLYLDYDTSEIYQAKPSWLTKLEKICAEDPDNIHIVFFDEFTNAPGIIQGLVMNVCLYHRVGIGGWPLPPNARVVAAGNEVIDSKAAKKMPEPVYGRFSHLYLKFNVENWIKWAIENNIHPLVLDFIINKEYQSEDNSNTNNLSVLMPEHQDDQKIVNPRVWEAVSNQIYRLEENYRSGKTSGINLRILDGKLPDAILQSFLNFAKNYSNVITVEGILSGKKYDLSLYEKPDLLMAIRGLLRVKNEDSEIIRAFIKENMGNEGLAIFDSLYNNKKEEVISHGQK